MPNLTQEQLNKRLLEAIEDNNIEAFRRALEEGADVDSQTRYKNTLLHEAAYWGRKEIARVLIDNGIPVNARNMFEHTPLYIATVWEHTETVDLLEQQGGVK